MNGQRRRLLFREVNERIADVSVDLALELPVYELFCECRTPDCAERVRIPARTFETVRRSTDRFVVAPGHARPHRGDQVIRDEPGFALVTSAADRLASPVLSAAPSAA